MCQYACLPAPKTVTSWTDLRFLNSAVDAKAVRNAVSSSALITPRGFPTASKRLREPRGVVSCVLEEAEMEDAGVIGGRSSVDLDVAVLAEGVEDEIESDDIEIEGDEVSDGRSLLAGCVVVRQGAASVTILTPKPSLLEAGMNNVVNPSLRLRAVLWGWYVALQPLSSTSVEVE